jgi:hypothetical protein
VRTTIIDRTQDASVIKNSDPEISKIYALGLTNFQAVFFSNLYILCH